MTALPARPGRDLAPRHPQPDPDGDAALVARVARGDARAYEVLVKCHLPRVLALARRMLGDDTEAEDVAQETFLRLWRKAGDYDERRARLTTWLYRMATNLCIDRLRKKRGDPLDEVDIPAVAPDQHRAVEESELRGRLDLALQGLPERQRMALVLCHYQDLPMRETADIMDASVEAVESLLARARRSLKTRLDSEWRALLPEPEL